MPLNANNLLNMTNRGIDYYGDFDFGIENIAITRFNLNLLPYSKIKFDTSFANDLVDKTWSFLCESDISPSLAFRKSEHNGFSGKIIVTVNGKGVGGDFSIEKDKTISIIINNNAFLLNCVYYDKSVMILQFDNSNEHICLFKKESVFAKSSAHIGLDDLQRHLDNKLQQTELNLYERKDKIIGRLLFFPFTFIFSIACLLGLWVGRYLLENIFSKTDIEIPVFFNLQDTVCLIFISISTFLGLFVSIGICLLYKKKAYHVISCSLMFLFLFGPIAILTYIYLCWGGFMLTMLVGLLLSFFSIEIFSVNFLTIMHVIICILTITGFSLYYFFEIFPSVKEECTKTQKLNIQRMLLSHIRLLLRFIEETVKFPLELLAG